MAIQIHFDPVNNPELPTMILATRTGIKLGQIEPKAVTVLDDLKNPAEMAFTIYKEVDGVETPLWDSIVDLKLIWCADWDLWYEIHIDLEESNGISKSVYCSSLGEAELSQVNLNNIEINTEADIAREDYLHPSILYKPNIPYESILDRLLSKAPHYKVKHVDRTIANIQRSFSFDGVSIWDGLQQVAEEIDCLILCNNGTDSDGQIERSISVYDLESNCQSCGYRGEFVGQCPECGSTSILEGYGEDTGIFLSSDELADDIKLTTDIGAVKNCFRVLGGDELMNATVINCNPNGTAYIWYLSDAMKADMPQELVEKIEQYDAEYQAAQTNRTYNLNALIVAAYNLLIEKYSVYHDDLEPVSATITGFPALMKVYYDTIDFGNYLDSELMPSVEISEVTAQQQMRLLTSENLSPVGTTSIQYISNATADNLVLGMAKAIVDNRYQVKILSSNLDKTSGTVVWTGTFRLTNYSDDTDTMDGTNPVTVIVNDDYETYVKQKVQKALHEKDTKDMSISGLFNMEQDDFEAELKKYCLNSLKSFHDACQACIDILIEQGVGTAVTWAGEDPNLYEAVYEPYYNKLQAIEAEMTVREYELNIVRGLYDDKGGIRQDGLQTNVESVIEEVQEDLDFEDYLGDVLWKQFISYRREDNYQNDNYISDGLNNTELVKKALELTEEAKKEIYKSAELQHSISTTLKNLLAMDKFKPLLNKFSVGNWLRISIDGVVYKLRLLKYEVDFNDFNKISVDFSDVFKTRDGLSDKESVISQAQQMASSYGGVKRQAKKTTEISGELDSWYIDGMNVENLEIINGKNGQSQSWDEHGLLFRRYNEDIGDYDGTQMRIINSTIAITDDYWQSVKTAIGLFKYVDPISGQMKETYGINGETIRGRMLIGESLVICNTSGSLQFNENGLSVTSNLDNSNSIIINPNSHVLFNIKHGSNDILAFSDNGTLTIVGDITARSLTLLSGATVDTRHISGLATIATTGNVNDLLQTNGDELILDCGTSAA